MAHPTPAPFLRRTLLVDALASGGIGVVLVVAAGVAAALLGLPDALLRSLGVQLMSFAAAVLWLAREARPAEVAIWAVIAANGGWGVASIGLLVSGWVAPTVLGLVLVIAQAITVGLFAELQYLGLRRVHTGLHGQQANG